MNHHPRFKRGGALGLAALTFLCISTLNAADQAKIPLWPERVPGALGTDTKDIPTLTPYLPSPDKANGTAIVLCQGGSYLGYYAGQGEPFARWLNDQGIAVFLLEYRLGSSGYRYPSQLNDLSRAVRIVRARAGEWHVDPQRVGVMGFSAGGHLVSSLCVKFDRGQTDAQNPVERESCRPDFAILCYPVISMVMKPERGTRGNLLGNAPTEEALNAASSELHVTADTPPCFIWHTYEDSLVPPDHSMLFAQALIAAKVPVAFHLYEKGPHGTGLMGTNHPWMNDLLHWMRERKLLTKSS